MAEILSYKVLAQAELPFMAAENSQPFEVRATRFVENMRKLGPLEVLQFDAMRRVTGDLLKAKTGSELSQQVVTDQLHLDNFLLDDLVIEEPEGTVNIGDIYLMWRQAQQKEMPIDVETSRALAYFIGRGLQDRFNLEGHAIALLLLNEVTDQEGTIDALKQLDYPVRRGPLPSGSSVLLVPAQRERKYLLDESQVTEMRPDMVYIIGQSGVKLPQKK